MIYARKISRTRYQRPCSRKDRRFLVPTPAWNIGSFRPCAESSSKNRTQFTLLLACNRQPAPLLPQNRELPIVETFPETQTELVYPNLHVCRRSRAETSTALPVNKPFGSSQRPPIAPRDHLAFFFRQNFHLLPPLTDYAIGRLAVAARGCPEISAPRSLQPLIYGVAPFGMAHPTAITSHLAPLPHNTTSTVEIRIMKSRNRE